MPLTASRRTSTSSGVLYRAVEARTDAMHTRTLVEDLMGRKPEKRYAFIQEHAKFARDLDV